MEDQEEAMEFHSRWDHSLLDSTACLWYIVDVTEWSRTMTSLLWIIETFIFRLADYSDG